MTSAGTLDDQYFEWLYSQIASVRNKNPARSYWGLARQFYTKEFIWSVPNDDNRVEDGRDLRDEFIRERGVTVSGEWLELECSFLEMLIALARRAAFESEGSPVDWFWTLVRNLGLREYNDAAYNELSYEIIDQRLDVVVYRRYSKDGWGGLFPLNHPTGDQRKVELWYQMAAYLLEATI